MSDRIKSFKNKGWVDADESRRRRKEGAVELRKVKVKNTHKLLHIFYIVYVINLKGLAKKYFIMRIQCL